MSSATVLFVIKHILDLPAAEDGQDSTGGAGGERICSMAFGPGLTVETALFTRLQAPRCATAPRQERSATDTETSGAGAERAQPVPVRT
jgi:hypothetical protein